MKAEQNSSKSKSQNFNLLWWLLTIALIAVGVVGNYYFDYIAWSVRLAGLIVLGGVVIITALQTRAGQRVFVFAKEAKVELNKVVWPTRPETLQTTAIIIGLVILTAIVLWGIDRVLLWAVNWLTGQRV